jgi:hypothetical protein
MMQRGVRVLYYNMNKQSSGPLQHDVNRQAGHARFFIERPKTGEINPMN